MNESEFREWLRTRNESIQRLNHSNHPRIRGDQKLQESEAGRNGDPIRRDQVPDELDTQRHQILDGKTHPKYKLTVTLLVADKRRRDADGMLSSLLDAMVKSVRRFNPMDPGDKHQGKAS